MFELSFHSGITYDISNKHRLGYSEVQLVQTMIDGVGLNPLVGQWLSPDECESMISQVNTLVTEDLELQKKHGIA